MPLSGSSQSLGKELLSGAELYFEHINKKGGVKGQLLEWVVYDDQYTPNQTVKNTVRLIEKDQVDILFSYVGTPTVTRILPLLKQYQDKHINLYFPFTGAEPQRRPPYDAFVFNFRASYMQETSAIVNYFVKNGKKAYRSLLSIGCIWTKRLGWSASLFKSI